MQVSRDGFRRFVRWFLGIEETEFGYHQTLTFKRDVPEKEAKKLLTQLFKKLIRRFPTIVLFYAMRRQPRTKRLHFHVRVHFYREDGLPFPETLMERRLRTIIFAEWNKLNSGELARRAHDFKRYPKDLGYLLWDVTVVNPKTKTVRPKGNVWGYANKKVLMKHFVEPSQKTMTKVLNRYLGVPKCPKPHYSMYALRKEKDEVELNHELRNFPNWEEHKKRLTRRKEKVSDKDFQLWKNGFNPWERLTKAKMATMFPPPDGDEDIF